MNTLPEHSCDVLIIGSGAAGLSLALRLADQHQVIVLSKGPVTEGSTFYAQGGIAAVFDETDSIDSHVEDTLIAGAGICDRHAVEFVASNARSCVQWLIDQGVLFDTHIQPNGEESYHLTREGGHSHRRILHAADATGREVETTLVGKAQNHPNIRVLERSNAVDLIVSDKIGLPGTRRVVGAWVWNRNKETVETCHAKAVVLATGGASKVYQYTTNPDISSGDGIAMAWRAGCRVANLEFNQFHPTALYHPQARNFLLTEALRGEGAYLRRPDGSRFMQEFDPRGELAPRDIVARAIDYEMKRLGVDCMYLDISHKPADFVIKHFPTIYERCLKIGIDITTQSIPVVPAAHYTCGGIVSDLNGRTDVAGLYVAGEASCTGLHGANRLASNSLLECLVFAEAAVNDILSTKAAKLPALPQWDESRVTDAVEEVVISHDWDELRRFMWDYVGIVRTTKRLKRAKHRIGLLMREIDEFYANFKVSHDLIELRNLVVTADLIVRCAMQRKESRGLHFSRDYPETATKGRNTVLKRRTTLR